MFCLTFHSSNCIDTICWVTCTFCILSYLLRRCGETWRKGKLYQAKEILIATDNLNVIFKSSEITSESQKASLLQLGLSERKLLHLQPDNEYLLGINYILCKMWPEIIWRLRTEHISSLQSAFETFTCSVCWNMKGSCGCVSSGLRVNCEV